LLPSCNKDASSEPGEQPTYQQVLHSKRISVEDEHGNQAIVEISSVKKDVIENHTEQDFVMLTTTNIPDPEGYVEISDKGEKWSDADFDIEKTIFVDVVSYQLQPGIVGFFVQPKAAATFVHSSNVEQRWDYDYEFGANDIRGAQVVCLQRSGNITLSVKLSKRNSSNDWFWDRISEGTLNAAGQSWWACSTTEYWKYRLGTNTNGNGSIIWSQFWLLCD